MIWLPLVADAGAIAVAMWARSVIASVAERRPVATPEVLREWLASLLDSGSSDGALILRKRQSKDALVIIRTTATGGRELNLVFRRTTSTEPYFAKAASLAAEIARSPNPINAAAAGDRLQIPLGARVEPAAQFVERFVAEVYGSEVTSFRAILVH